MPFYELSECSAKEVFGLLKILSWYSVHADVRQTLGPEEELEPFFSIQNIFFNVDYTEIENRTDAIVLKLGDPTVNGIKFRFDVGRSQFAKQISNDQLSFTMFDKEKGIKVWFESDVVPDEAMDEIERYVPEVCTSHVKDLPDGGCVVKSEGVAFYFSEEEMQEMKQDYLLAKHREKMENWS